ncbi:MULTISPECIES: DUF1385 domain-containing protein [unclassified Pseudodesulfovibrio]|uniref:DUF1385 domain-containing protein n=1 Tax=unclassified Pseudodesulfovibrio TaxID=2661612 RepID=UPI000FEC0567|nr:MULTISPECIES: DUF1385 domain-containing protein [unclassified Pseudodesulfovibrio]MCJ2164040.1 DUF1385 domain-containing protein [Pseudodesulfovibrio sp. S3-i]RWU05324.1 DUF1385 domain-containing protein [Pseudodesulfovibrio sp. S3]
MAAPQAVGGQAVIEGVMMRSKDRLAIAVRKSDGEIVTEIRPWFSLVRHPLLKKPFLRGFPVLMETMVNGIKALNYSAMQAAEGDEDEGGELTTWHLVLTMVLALGAALGLFVVLPHFLSVGMEMFGWAGDVDSLSFHAWDGAIKMVVFVAYILAISFIPDIRRVFQYHGAEHKVIWTWEEGRELSPDSTRFYSRLHPRCGTAFLLFVLVVSIMLYAVLVPYLLTFFVPENFIIKHLYIVGMKLILMVPVSCVAYEMIKFAGKYSKNILCKFMCWPGLMLQLLTTKEPDDSQIEVAIAALQCAVNIKEC